MSSFLLSLVASLLAASCVPFFIEVWNKVIMPWWAEVTYRDIKIAGEWLSEANYEENGQIVDEKEHATVQQRGYSVWGELASSRDNVVYLFKGNISNSILNAIYHKKGSGHSFDTGVFSLRVSDDRSAFGSFTYYEGSMILTGKYKWTMVT